MRYACYLVIGVSLLLAVGAKASEARTGVLLQKLLPDIPGKEILMLELEYAPGAASPAHLHNAHTFVYVLKGALVMQVEGQNETIVQAGQTFYETPADVHVVSKNASDTEPARFLVYFLKEADAPASVPADR